MRNVTTDTNLAYLAPAEYVDSDHPAVRAEAARLASPSATPIQKAQAFYVAVRDIFYNYVDHDDLVLSRLTTAGDTEMGFEAPLPASYQPESLADVERAHILRTLGATAWNKSKTATILGIERSTLDRKIRRYGLEPDRPRI